MLGLDLCLISSSINHNLVISCETFVTTKVKVGKVLCQHLTKNVIEVDISDLLKLVVAKGNFEPRDKLILPSCKCCKYADTKNY